MEIEHVIVFFLVLMVVLLWRYIVRKKPGSLAGTIVVVNEPDGDKCVFLKISQANLDGRLKNGEIVNFLVSYESYEDFVNSQE